MSEVLEIDQMKLASYYISRCDNDGLLKFRRSVLEQLSNALSLPYSGKNKQELVEQLLGYSNCSKKSKQSTEGTPDEELTAEVTLALLLAHSMDQCDREGLQQFDKEFIRKTVSALNLPTTNKSKDELIDQLLDFKGCNCLLKKLQTKGCHYLKKATLYAALAVGLYYLDQVAGNTIGPYGGNPLVPSKGLAIDIYDLGTVAGNCRQLPEPFKSMCLVGGATSIAVSRNLGY